LDDILKSCQESIGEALAERQLIRYLLWLGFEKKEKEKEL